MMGLGGIVAWFATSRVGQAIAAGFGIAGAIGLAVLKVFSAGKAVERAKQDHQSLENLQQRAKENDEVRTLSGDDLRQRLNRWVSNGDER